MNSIIPADHILPSIAGFSSVPARYSATVPTLTVAPVGGAVTVMSFQVPVPSVECFRNEIESIYKFMSQPHVLALLPLPQFPYRQSSSSSQYCPNDGEHLPAV